MPAQLLTYRCPHCQHAIEVDPALAEQTVTCSNPECGKPFHLDVPTARPEPLLVVPPDIHQRPQEAEPLRPPEEKSEHETANELPGEKELLTVKPVMFRRYPFRCLGYVFVILAGLACLVFWCVEHEYSLALGLLGIVVTAIAGFRLLNWWVD